MTFDEFFKKKRIDLLALEKAEQSLFSEFKTHYGEMGEKSFDHTKKYWFNKLRRQFPLAPEVKTEKPQISNPLAEQTITESLTETGIAVPPSPKVGFVPRFKAGIVTNTSDKKEEATPVQAVKNTIKESTPAANTPTPVSSKVGFVPRFKAGNMSKPQAGTDDKKDDESAPIDNEVVKEQPAEPSNPATQPQKIGFVPRFKVSNMAKPIASTDDKKEDAVPTSTNDEAVKERPAESSNSATQPPKVGFVPRFKASNMAKPVVNADDKKEDTASTPIAEEPAKDNTSEATKAKTYQPRFKMKPKDDESNNS